jgi:Flp pilus assembly protein TadB
VTELIDRLKDSTTTLFGLPPSLADLDPEERRLLKIAAAFAVAVLWLAIALVDVWLLLAVPVVVLFTRWAIRRKRANQPKDDEPDMWSY